MFACIYFMEDASLSVVGQNDKDLTFSEFKEKENVQMRRRKKPGQVKELFHGVIIKIGDQESLNKFADTANTKILKRLKAIPEEAPEELFSFSLESGFSTKKRQRQQTQRAKESEQQETEISPKKKKQESVRKQKSSLQVEKKTREAVTPKKSKATIQKKKCQETTAYSINREILQSGLVSQFNDDLNGADNQNQTDNNNTCNDEGTNTSNPDVRENPDQ